jgi:hypothetical protein
MLVGDAAVDECLATDEWVRFVVHVSQHLHDHRPTPPSRVRTDRDLWMKRDL